MAITLFLGCRGMFRCDTASGYLAIWKQRRAALSYLYIRAKYRAASQCCERGCRLLLHNVAEHIYTVSYLGYILALLH